jgi:hypothetical protein
LSARVNRFFRLSFWLLWQGVPVIHFTTCVAREQN